MHSENQKYGLKNKNCGYDIEMVLNFKKIALHLLILNDFSV